MWDGRETVPHRETAKQASLPQIHPHKPRHLFAHELRAPLVDLLVRIHRLCSLLLVLLVEARACVAPFFLPRGVLLLELVFRDAFRGGDEADSVAYQNVELAVAVDVVDPDARRAGGAGEFLFAE